MKKKRVLKLIGRYYNRLDKKSRKMSPAYDPEVIHSFRTNYKKLKAFLHMIHVPGIPAKLKDFYHHTGILRDLQLQEQYIAPDVRKLPTYSKILHKQAEQSKRELDKHLSKKLVAKAKRKTIAKIKSDFSHKMYQRYLQEKTAAMQHMLEPEAFSDNDLHSIRKSFKELSYNHQLHGSIIQDKLGDFQDRRNALRLLRKCWPSHVNKKEACYLRHKEQVLLTEKKKMKALLVKALKTIK